MVKTLTFLGTGTSQGIPVIACECPICTSQDPKDNRTRTAVMVTWGDKNVVIDSGPDFRAQMLREKVKDIEGIVFTHEHKDHIAGLDDIRAFNYFHQKPIDVFCTDRVEEALRREFAYAFSDSKYPGIPEIALQRIDLHPFNVAGIEFIPIEVLHLQLPVLGFRMGDLTYITDANFISEQEFDKIAGTRILILNALRHEKHPSHFNLQEAIAIVEKVRPEVAYFTHISHQLGKHEEMESMLPPNIRLAFDGLKINF